MNSEGVHVLDDWQTSGMRGTGSHTVRLDNVYIPESSVTLRRPRGEFHPVFNVIAAAALPLIMSVYVGIAQKAARDAVEVAKRQKRPKPQLPDAIGGMLNQLTSAEVHRKDMVRLANELDFEPENQIGQEALSRKTNVANACVGVVTRAMEIAGGPGFYRDLGLERLFGDVQAAKYHPLPERDQERLLGEHVLGKGEGATELTEMVGVSGNGINDRDREGRAGGARDSVLGVHPEPPGAVARAGELAGGPRGPRAGADGAGHYGQRDHPAGGG